MTTTTRFILLPGLHGTDELFGPLLEHAPEAPTHVVTYPHDPALHFEDYVARVRKQLPAEPHVVIAESFSGPVAIAAAATKPPGLRGLVLCNTFTRRPGSHAFLLLPLTTICSMTVPQWACRRYLSGSDRLVKPIKAAQRKTPPDVYAARLRIALKVDVTDTFRGLDLPILCLQGSRDKLIKPRPMAKLAATHRRAKVRWFDAPHMLLQSHPRACWDAILDWHASAVSPESSPARASGSLSLR